jgi:hypothetical protein
MDVYAIVVCLHLFVLQGERLQKEMKIETLPPAIGYETKTAHDRARSGTLESNFTIDSNEPEADPEILAHEGDISDSPKTLLRKKI